MIRKYCSKFNILDGCDYWGCLFDPDDCIKVQDSKDK